MDQVSVITGGAGGMGLATARLLGATHHVIISDVNEQRLEAAVAGLRALGHSCEGRACDVTSRASVDALLQHAASKGRLASVVHTAGVSPQMTSAENIMKINGVGTIHVTQACLAAAHEGFALVNVASMAAYMLPSWLLPTGAYRAALTDPDAFLRRALFLVRFLPQGLARTGMAYSISKNFVVWYSRRLAGEFGAKGARLVSVSPGSFDTEMGRLEEKSGSAKMLETAALKRFGKPEEIAEMLAFCAGPKASYLTGVDILCDGGVIAGRG